MSDFVHSVSPLVWHFVFLPSFFFLPLPTLSVFHTPSFAVRDVTMKRNQEMMLPTAWRELHSHYNGADVYCCWQCRVHRNKKTPSHTEHARTNLAHTLTHTEGCTVYVSGPGLEQRRGYRSSCVFLSWVEPTFHMRLTQGSDLFSSTYREAASFL